MLRGTAQIFMDETDLIVFFTLMESVVDVDQEDSPLEARWQCPTPVPCRLPTVSPAHADSSS